MSKVETVKVGGIPVPGLFKRVETEGDLYRIVTAETGHSEIIHRDNTTKVTAHISETPPYYEFTLGFRYLVGLKQLNVGIMSPGTGRISPMADLAVVEAARADPSWPSGVLDPLSTSFQYYSEISEDTVRVYHLGATDKVLIFSVPHTSLQAILRNAVVVDKQGNNVALEALGEGDGILLTARNGRKGLLTLDDQLGITVVPR